MPIDFSTANHCRVPYLNTALKNRLADSIKPLQCLLVSRPPACPLGCWFLRTWPLSLAHLQIGCYCNLMHHIFYRSNCLRSHHPFSFRITQFLSQNVLPFVIFTCFCSILGQLDRTFDTRTKPLPSKAV